MSLPIKSLVAYFVYKHPNSTPTFIAGSLDIKTDLCRSALYNLLSQGKLTKKKVGKRFAYSTVPDFIPLATERTETTNKKYTQSQIDNVEKKIAELESRGFMRRAESLLAQLSAMQNSSSGVGLIALRRNECIRKLRSRA
ncbi:hypothetical protein ACSD30_000772 [Escherichia coli]|nr:hypothetical protein [Escherichia coli]EJG8081958.1 hypothetical protein [Escherichia coli]ELO1960246.1 hypothetical protein [Escherichia coli]ELO3079151.1 hypothetical protein [Escherichia coli]ELO3209639.1 hypothetical protein [Escherichia coli]